MQGAIAEFRNGVENGRLDGGRVEAPCFSDDVDDPLLTELARGAARTLQLRFERRFTGYGELANRLVAFESRHRAASAAGEHVG